MFKFLFGRRGLRRRFDVIYRLPGSSFHLSRPIFAGCRYEAARAFDTGFPDLVRVEITER